MPRIIVKSGYMKKGSDASKYLKYIATRDGVQLSNTSSGHKAATQKQKELIGRLLHDYPKSKALLEYQDYQNTPTRQLASTLIEQIFDEHLNELISRAGYVDYIANRPRVERLGLHGLFSDKDQPIDLNQIVSEIENHQGNVWTHIVSLKREDAERLGYNHAKRWATLIRSKRNELAKIMNIHPGNLKWFGAYHDESHHPHIHMVVYSTDLKEGHLTKEGINQLRSTLANDIFKYELLNLYQEQTQIRDDLKLKTQEKVRALISSIEDNLYYDDVLHAQIAELKMMLDRTSGRLQYGYLNKETKAKVDKLVERIAMFPEIDALYAIWKGKREAIHQTYQDKYKEHLPLHLQKEFRSLKNILIKEIAGFELNPSEQKVSEPLEHDLSENLGNTIESGEPINQPVKNVETDVLFFLEKMEDEKKKTVPIHRADQNHHEQEEYQQNGTLLITRLMHHTSRILNDEIEHKMSQLTQGTDSKLRMKIKMKKQLQGHRWE